MEHAHNVEVGDDELRTLMKGRDTRWYRGHLLKLNFILLLLLITSANNGYDGSMMNGLQYVTILDMFNHAAEIDPLLTFRTLKTWQDSFGNPTGSLLGIFNAIQSIGGIAGLPFAPFLSDRYGRRMTMFIGACSKYSESRPICTSTDSVFQSCLLVLLFKVRKNFPYSFSILPSLADLPNPRVAAAQNIGMFLGCR